MEAERTAMEMFFSLLFKSHTLAFLAPFMVFVITVFLVVRRLIGFLMTIAFLGFAVVAGVAIANYDVVKEMLPREDRQKISELERMIKEFKADLERAFTDLNEDFRDQRQSLRRLANNTRDMLDEVDEHTHSFRTFVQDTMVPAMEVARNATAPKTYVAPDLKVPEELQELHQDHEALTCEAE